VAHAYLMNALVVEVQRGADGKRYPSPMPPPRRETWRSIHASHLLAHNGLSVRQVQRELLVRYGLRRSIGSIHRYCRSTRAIAAPYPSSRPLRRNASSKQMAEPVNSADRQLAIGELDRIEGVISEISTWLTLHDQDKAAIQLECSARDVAAAAWVLEMPLRLRPEGWLTGSDT
jgi:hypothetical protein